MERDKLISVEVVNKGLSIEIWSQVGRGFVMAHQNEEPCDPKLTRFRSDTLAILAAKHAYSIDPEKVTGVDLSDRGLQNGMYTTVINIDKDPDKKLPARADRDRFTADVCEILGVS